VRKLFIAGNWKQNGRLALVEGALHTLSKQPEEMWQDCEVSLFLPYPLLDFAIDKKQMSALPLVVGAQNVSAYADGAYTGEVSADLLAELGAKAVLVGHSERRALFNESEAQILAKIQRAQAAGLNVVWCIGETQLDREDGQHFERIRSQLVETIRTLGIAALHQIVIAYEPVWAIGTGLAASTHQIQEMHQYIRELISDFDQNIAEQLRIIYGGSLNRDNIGQVLIMPDVDGALVGGASLDPSHFVSLCHIGTEVNKKLES
jgi:triosephosphate isomerase (TIM)